MSEAESLNRRLRKAEESTHDIQYKRIKKVPDDLGSLVQELEKIQQTYRTASHMSNVGANQFMEALNDVVLNLKQATDLIGNIKL